MELSVESAWQVAQVQEKELHARLKESDPTFEQVEQLIADYRIACESVLFADFLWATDHRVGARLWEAHSQINARFRRHLARYQTDEGKKKVVEKRKLIKHYLDYIKSSQRFYRSYIQKLSIRFGLPELEQVAHKLKKNDEADQPPVVEEPRLGEELVVSCYEALVRLGDLSRYRETELAPAKDRNWGPAIGYYELACTIHSQSGMAYNQLAVIALADGNHLRATYHLYRALAVEEPYPAAQGNLEKELSKIILTWRKGQLIGKSGFHDGTAGSTLAAWFVLLHARCSSGEEFAEHQELENEFLSRLGTEVKEISFTSNTLHRFALVNIAAEYRAGLKYLDHPESKTHAQAHLFFLRLNVKTFRTLLVLLQTEFEHDIGKESNISKQLTPTARRLLPGLRDYSSWLLSFYKLLNSQKGDENLAGEITELWRAYSAVLTSLTAKFPVEKLPSLEYMLEEDEDTVGFKPFAGDEARRRFFAGEGGEPRQRKPRVHDAGVHRQDADTEMLARVRDLLHDGLEMIVVKSIPIIMIGGSLFKFEDDTKIPSAITRQQSLKETTKDVESKRSNSMEVSKASAGIKDQASAPRPIHGHSSTSPMQEDAAAALSHQIESGAVVETTSIVGSMSSALNYMVDSLVGPDSPTKRNHNEDKDVDVDVDADMYVDRGLAQFSLAEEQAAANTRAAAGPHAAATTTTITTTTPTTVVDVAELVKQVQNYSRRPARASQPSTPRVDGGLESAGPTAVSTAAHALTPSFSQQSTPRPLSSSSSSAKPTANMGVLPSIWNTPFAPLMTDTRLSSVVSASAPASASATGTASPNFSGPGPGQPHGPLPLPKSPGLGVIGDARASLSRETGHRRKHSRLSSSIQPADGTTPSNRLLDLGNTDPTAISHGSLFNYGYSPGPPPPPLQPHNYAAAVAAVADAGSPATASMETPTGGIRTWGDMTFLSHLGSATPAPAATGGGRTTELAHTPDESAPRRSLWGPSSFVDASTTQDHPHPPQHPHPQLHPDPRIRNYDALLALEPAWHSPTDGGGAGGGFALTRNASTTTNSANAAGERAPLSMMMVHADLGLGLGLGWGLE
ncbi:MAG: hypothetical protein M1826_005522 [Phylliscum demangeonii]|nr:MAG: hypothetical protein M1826_005522 [Phylliscum demangeonii]